MRCVSHPGMTLLVPYRSRKVPQYLTAVPARGFVHARDGQKIIPHVPKAASSKSGCFEFDSCFVPHVGGQLGETEGRETAVCTLREFLFSGSRYYFPLGTQPYHDSATPNAIGRLMRAHHAKKIAPCGRNARSKWTTASRQNGCQQASWL